MGTGAGGRYAVFKTAIRRVLASLGSLPLNLGLTLLPLKKKKKKKIPRPMEVVSVSPFGLDFGW